MTNEIFEKGDTVTWGARYYTGDIRRVYGDGPFTIGEVFPAPIYLSQIHHKQNVTIKYERNGYILTSHPLSGAWFQKITS